MVSKFLVHVHKFLQLNVGSTILTSDGTTYIANASYILIITLHLRPQGTNWRIFCKVCYCSLGGHYQTNTSISLKLADKGTKPHHLWKMENLEHMANILPTFYLIFFHEDIKLLSVAMYQQKTLKLQGFQISLLFLPETFVGKNSEDIYLMYFVELSYCYSCC